MSYFKDTVIINRPVEAVYNFITNAGDWPKWHENSKGVEGDINGPMKVNEVVREKVKIPLSRGYIEWKCTLRNYPHEFNLDGNGMGGRGYVNYKFEACAEGTRFTRTMDFGFYEGFMMRMEKLITPMVKKAQTKSVNNMKTTVERYI